MARLILDISMSLDGFVAGPNQTLEEPLGKGGEGLHEWVTRLASWRAPHGLEGGETGVDDEVFAESVRAAGAFVMGRRMFSGGAGAWDDDPNADGWWGDDPPFHAPVFVLTHHARETVAKESGTSYTFVTDGIEHLAGGADVAQQYLKAGLLDEMQIHLVPLFLGGGVRLFDRLGAEPIELETTRVIESPMVTHLRYRPVK
jgi:dihydrofolate reductase